MPESGLDIFSKSRKAEGKKMIFGNGDPGRWFLVNIFVWLSTDPRMIPGLIAPTRGDYFIVRFVMFVVCFVKAKLQFW